MTITTFSDFIEQAYLRWQSDLGKRKTLDEFANYLGISRPLLIAWMRGKRRPGPKNEELLIAIYGDIIYDALDKPRPDPRLRYVETNWSLLSEEQQQNISEEVSKYIIKKDNMENSSNDKISDEL